MERKSTATPYEIHAVPQHPMFAFESEGELAPATPAPIARAQAASGAVAPQTIRRWPWSTIAFALVAVAAIVQAALIAAWWSSGRLVAAVPDTGLLTITSDPPGAPIVIDGEPRGTTPYAATVAAGVHHLEIGDGERRYAQPVNIKRGGDASVHASLPLVRETPRGILNINALPGADVWIDGARIGKTPMASLSLPNGTHEIVLRHPAFGLKRRTVAIGATGGAVIADFRK